MLCILLENNNPYFCLAAEEYLLKNFSEDIFLLWQSDKTVVIGKHQIAPAEINFPYVQKNGITIARRISGGGTVYHDLGNLNFAFIKTVDSPADINFHYFISPIVASLSRLGLKATTSGRNDLIIAGKKISGNAQHIYKNRVLHHGTLLFNSQLDTLKQALITEPGVYLSKAVPSVRSSVVNISSFLGDGWSYSDFKNFIFNDQLNNQNSLPYSLSEADIQKINDSVKKRFSTWEWNFGYSPQYKFQKATKIAEKYLEINLHVKRGFITDIILSGDYFNLSEISILTESLSGIEHSYHQIYNRLKGVRSNINDDLVFSFF